MAQSSGRTPKPKRELAHIPPYKSNSIDETILKELFWVARGTLQMAENIRLNSDDVEATATWIKLDEQYYYNKLGEDDGSYRIQESLAAIEAYVSERVREAKLEEWRAILGVDFDRVYPEDKLEDFIKLTIPSFWINQQISEIKMDVKRISAELESGKSEE